MNRKLVFARIGADQTVRFAFDELVRCLRRMDPTLRVEGRVYDVRDSAAKGVIWLGLDGSVPAGLDDEICIDVTAGVGTITGSNPHSVLIAAYRFLYELGCRWLRPGEDGEILPERKIDADTLQVQVREKASYRHRAMCIEGINTYEHIHDMIDWLPKVGMNGYFMQFHVPHCFFEGRYNSDIIPVFEGEEKLTAEDVKRIWKSLEEDITRRGLFYHATGHGWTCEPFGIPGGGWFKDETAFPPEVTQYLAQVNGKRELWGGVALNTNLCYSNPEVRERMTDAITAYCQEHSDVDYLHFWLADGTNNHCECDECRKMRPADYYIMLLNELDRKMTAAGVDTKVVFLIYVDLLWEPEHFRIENPDRFVLMFAPITRTYTTAFTDYDRSETVELSPYDRNHLIMPSSVAENVARLSRWQAQFEGDSFDFDYHLMWDHNNDPGYYECARILHSDMVNLDKIGLNGMVSCQVQRTAFPTGLPLYAMARGLWDKTSDFEAIADEYFEASFGEDGPAVKAYLSTLSKLFHPAYLRGELPRVDASLAADFAAVEDVVKAFRASHVDAHREESASWRYLDCHGEYCILLSQLLALRACGKDSAEKLEAVRRWLDENQERTDHVLDAPNTWRSIRRAGLDIFDE